MNKKLLQSLTAILALVFLLLIVVSIIYFDNKIPENFKIAFFPSCLFCAFFGWFVAAQKDFVKEDKKEIVKSTEDWDMK